MVRISFLKLLIGFIVCVSLAPSICLAEDGQSFFVVGAALHDSTVKVTNNRSGEHGKAVSSEKDLDIGLLLQYTSSPGFFGSSHFGYRFALNYKSFELGYQSVDLVKESIDSAGATRTETTSHTLDLGTRTYGRSFYFNPAVFYLMGDNPDTIYGLVGLGAGFGLVQFEGDLYMTEGTSSSNNSCYIASSELNIDGIKSQCERRSYKYNSGWSLEPVWSVIAEVRFYRLIASLTFAILNAEEDDNSFEVTDATFSLGYAF